MMSVQNSCVQCCLFQGLTLLMIPSRACHGNGDVNANENLDCDMDLGAQLSIAATTLWFVSCCMMMPTQDEARQVKQQQMEMIEEMKAKAKANAQGGDAA